MHTAPSSSDAEARLSLRRKIDAICDRFEEAWEAGQRPRIEDYLLQLPMPERRHLFEELLSSELALRRSIDPKVSYDDYLSRFPEYHGCVLDAFSGRSTLRIAADDLPPDRKRRELLIAQVRQQLQGSNPDTSLPLAKLEPLIEQLWGSTDSPGCGSTHEHNPESTAGLYAIVLQLLNAFPPSRRQMLIALLFGQGIAQTAEQHHATERTVAATAETAIDLLSRTPN